MLTREYLDNEEVLGQEMDCGRSDVEEGGKREYGRGVRYNELRPSSCGGISGYPFAILTLWSGDGA